MLWAQFAVGGMTASAFVDDLAMIVNRDQSDPNPDNHHAYYRAADDYKVDGEPPGWWLSMQIVQRIKCPEKK